MSSSAIVYSGLDRSKSRGSAILVDVAGKWVSLCSEVGEAGGCCGPLNTHLVERQGLLKITALRHSNSSNLNPYRDEETSSLCSCVPPCLSICPCASLIAISQYSLE